jgi:tetratricopeptide (TPR) repeat protein
MKKLSSAQLLVILGGVLFVLAILFPHTFWGFNHHAYLPKPVIVIIAALLAFVGFKAIRNENKTEDKPAKSLSNRNYVIAITALAFCFSQFFPMAIDAYGDSRSIINKVERIFNEDKTWFDALTKVFSLNIFDLHIGERLMFNMAYLVKLTFNTSFEKSFFLLNSVFVAFGALFFGLLTVKFSNLKKGISALLFFSGNYILATRGHVEVYSASIGFSFLFAYLVKRHLEKNTWNSFAILAFGGLLLMKSHINHVVVIAPILFLMSLTINPKLLERLTVKNIFILIGSGAIGFLMAYFLVFENHNSNYATRNADDLLYNVFLPLSGSEAPFNNYGILNLSHLIDWITLIVMWSPIAVIILMVTVFKRKEILLRNHFALILMFLVISYALIAFVINTLLSMPRDWDLLSLGAPFLVVLSISLVNQFENQRAALLQVGFLFYAFVLPRLVVESIQQSASNRLLGVGAHVHNTYYAGSSVILSSAIKEQDDPDYEQIKEFSLKLSDKAKVYPDNELCHFYTQAAYWLADEQKKPILALDFFRLALEQNKEYEIALKGAVIILQNQNNLSESLSLVQVLLEIQPNVKEYHQMLLNCYVALQMQKELQIAVNNYLKLFPEDRDMIRSKLGI